MYLCIGPPLSPLNKTLHNNYFVGQIREISKVWVYKSCNFFFYVYGLFYIRAKNLT